MTRYTFDGARLFDLKAEHGLPIDFALDRVIAAGVRAVDWPAFIERARACGWWDFQTFRALSEAVRDSDLPRTVQGSILDGFKRYVLLHPIDRAGLELAP